MSLLTSKSRYIAVSDSTHHKPMLAENNSNPDLMTRVAEALLGVIAVLTGVIARMRSMLRKPGPNEERIRDITREEIQRDRDHQDLQALRDWQKKQEIYRQMGK